MRERPREQLLIAAASQRFRFERRVVDVEELAAARVKTPFRGSAPCHLPCLRQCPRRRAPDATRGKVETVEGLRAVRGRRQAPAGRHLCRIREEDEIQLRQERNMNYLSRTVPNCDHNSVLFYTLA